MQFSWLWGFDPKISLMKRVCLLNRFSTTKYLDKKGGSKQKGGKQKSGQISTDKKKAEGSKPSQPKKQSKISNTLPWITVYPYTTRTTISIVILGMLHPYDVRHVWKSRLIQVKVVFRCYCPKFVLGRQSFLTCICYEPKEATRLAINSSHQFNSPRLPIPCVQQSSFPIVSWQRIFFDSIFFIFFLTSIYNKSCILL